MQIVMKKTSELIPYARNNKIHNERQIKLVAASIQEFGFKNPVIVDKDNSIIAGHGRVKAAELLKLDEVPCIVADDLTKAQIKAYRIADNKLADLGEYDVEMLQLEVQELQEMEFDVELLGVDVEEFAEEKKEIVEDEIPEVDETKEPYSKLGDIWLLGRHRLMCGDSTDKATVERLMDGQKADMVHTDPPYNVDYSNADRPKASKTDLGKIKNDVMSNEMFTEFLNKIACRIDENTKGEAGIYVWYASNMTVPFYLMFEGTDININQQVIWKKPMLLGRGNYQWAHEPCIYAKKGKAYFTNDRTKTTVWDFGGYDKSKNVHPTQKPLFLPTEAINNSSKMDDIVLDLFGGSGSTLIACEQANRINYSMELDEKYVDVIVKRYHNLGKDDIKLIRNGEVLEWETIKKDIVGD